VGRLPSQPDLGYLAGCWRAVESQENPPHLGSTIEKVPSTLSASFQDQKPETEH
jgi:hypothetical protein